MRGQAGHPLRGQAAPAASPISRRSTVLRDQHRLVLDAIRDGRLDDVLDKRETPETLAAIKELDVQWLNANSVHSDRNLTMRLRVTESGSGVSGARLTVRFARPDAAPFLCPGRHRPVRRHRDEDRSG